MVVSFFWGAVFLKSKFFLAEVNMAFTLHGVPYSEKLENQLHAVSWGVKSSKNMGW